MKKNVENYRLKKLWKKLKPYIKMNKKIIKFDDTECIQIFRISSI